MERVEGAGLFAAVAPGELERAVGHRPGAGGPRWWQALLDLVLPRRCVGCDRRGAWLCATCEPQLEWILDVACSRCGLPVLTPDAAGCPRCRQAPPRLAGIRAAWRHDGVARRLVHALKYGGLRALAPLLAVALEAALTRTPPLTGVLVPVPLHPARERQRGFNQSLVLARALAARRRPALPVVSGSLRRVRATSPQTHRDPEARRRNVTGAFVCADRSLAGETAILVDDVATTGATLEACAEALRAAGVRAVYALTLTRATGLDAR